MSVERRKFNRVPFEKPIRVKAIGGAQGSRYGDALARDISEGGIRFFHDHFIATTSRVLLEMTFPEADKPVVAVAKPVWVRELSNRSQFEVGNAFLEIADEDKQVIRSFVQRKRIP
ncbi:MAG: PilZ domain-containing protein [Candidatus Omnitrophota bacterium]|nr:PilZ domain-containing protein [Candidatus Omnitrophota bacterium]